MVVRFVAVWTSRDRGDLSVRLAAVSFDADQTLWDFHEVHQRALQSTAAEMVRRGYAPEGSVSVDLLQSTRDEVVQSFRGRPHSLEAVRQQSFEVILKRAGYDDAEAAARSLTAHFLDIRFNQIRLYPDVQPNLARLKGSYRLGLLSNGNSYPDRCGLPNMFDAVVLGPDIGVDKPDARAFSTIADRLGVDMSSMMHVGDGADDVDGANAVGAVSVLIVRDAPPPTSSTPDYTISNLDELQTVLDKVELRG